jgi:SSS family solute:Na+ symporter
MNPDATILKLVGYAWAGFGSSFGPVILMSLLWKRMTSLGALGGMMVGAVTVITWVQFPLLRDLMYEMIPGFFLSLLTIVIISLLNNPPSEEVKWSYQEVQDRLYRK